MKQFLEMLVEQGHQAKHVKLAGKKADQGKKIDEEVAIIQANWPIAGLIEPIHSVLDSSAATINYFRPRLIMA